MPRGDDVVASAAVRDRDHVLHDEGMADEITLADVEAARERIRDFVRTTPMWPSTGLSDRAGVDVMLKCENLQRTGSFKLRGASNMLAMQGDAAEGVVAASAGNHAQGVALAAQQRGLAATVVMPAAAPLAKQRATRAYGAELVLVDGPLSLAQERARALAAERGLLYVPPYDAEPIVAGQGTLGLDIVEQAPDVECVLVPAGGGGLLAGVALAVKQRRPDVRVVGVQSRAMPGIVESLAAGKPSTVEARRTIADGAAVAGPSALTFGLIERYVDDVIAVGEEQIASAIVFLIERSRLVVEGAGVLGVAALLAGAVEPRGTTVAVLSGGNIDVSLLGRLVERGLLVEGRRRRLTVAAANIPGELATITAAAAAGGANIIEVDHELATPDLPVGVARISLRLEVADDASYEALVQAMLAAGLVRGAGTDLATPAAAQRPG